MPFFPLGGFTRLQSTALEQVAKRLEATPMAVALAWLLQRSPNILLIPGTSTVAHLRENVAAAALQLPADELRCSTPSRGEGGPAAAAKPGGPARRLPAAGAGAGGATRTAGQRRTRRRRGRPLRSNSTPCGSIQPRHRETRTPTAATTVAATRPTTGRPRPWTPTITADPTSAHVA